MATAEQILDIARGELGTTESPTGSNKTKYGAWYGLDGQPWCMIFIQWCFDRAGVKLPARTASCGALMRAAQAAGCWVTADFFPGDVVIYDFPGGAATDHCGIVEAAAGSGVTAIEGNTSAAGSQSNGGQVCRKERPRSQIVGAVRPVFAAEAGEEDENMDVTRFEELWREMRRGLQDNDSGAYSQEARTWAVSGGLIQGSGQLSDGTPNYMWEDLLTREQLVTVLYRFAQKSGLL